MPEFGSPDKGLKGKKSFRSNLVSMSNSHSEGPGGGLAVGESGCVGEAYLPDFTGEGRKREEQL